MKQADIPSNGWVTLDGYAYQYGNSAITLPSSIFCIAKDSTDIEGYEGKDEIFWQSVYYRTGMNIIKTKFQMTSSDLDPPTPTDYTISPKDFSNTFSTDKMIDYIGNSSDGGTMVVWQD